MSSWQQKIRDRFGYKSTKQRRFEEQVELRRQEEQRELHRRELAEISAQVDRERVRLASIRLEREQLNMARVAPYPAAPQGISSGMALSQYDYNGQYPVPEALNVNQAGLAGVGQQYIITTGNITQSFNMNQAFREIYGTFNMEEIMNANLTWGGGAIKKKAKKNHLPDWF